MRIIFFLLIFFTRPVKSQVKLEPIIHSSKQEIAKKDSLNKASIVEQDDIETLGAHQLDELLRKSFGVAIASTGSITGESSAFIRGAESRHTLILIDGMKFYDPTSLGRNINLNTLRILDIERIELLEGTQSTLYGSDAIGGVINIITKKGSDKSSALVGGGYYSTLNLNQSLNFDQNSFHFAASYLESDELSTARNGAEKDNSINKTLSITHNFENEELFMKTVFRNSSQFNNTDTQEFSTGEIKDDFNNYSKNDQLFLSHSLEVKVMPQRTVYFDLSFSKHKRVEKFLVESDYQRSTFDGDSLIGEIRVKEQFLDGNLIYGISQSNDFVSSKELDRADQKMSDLFINHYQKFMGLSFDYGARVTHNQDFGTHLVYKAGVEKPFAQNQLFFGLISATGFKAPSISQLYSPDIGGFQIGNESLAPEKSLSHEFYSKINYGIYEGRVSFFNQKISDLVEFQNASGYVNSKELEIRGFEFKNHLSLRRIELCFLLNLYDFDKTGSFDVLRRAERNYLIFANHRISDEHEIGFNWNYQSDRADVLNNKQVKLGEFDTFDLNYKFSRKRVTLFANIQNLFDRKYELVKGYSTLGRSVSVRVKWDY